MPSWKWLGKPQQVILSCLNHNTLSKVGDLQTDPKFLMSLTPISRGTKWCWWNHSERRKDSDTNNSEKTDAGKDPCKSLGMVKCKQRAKDVLFWRGMARGIEQLVSTCDICLRYQPSNPKEPMMSSEVPTRPWEIVSTDLFCLDGEDSLLIVDSYSQYIEIAKLSNTSSKKVIECTKSVFARHDILRVTLVHSIHLQTTNSSVKLGAFSTQLLVHITHRPMA